MYFFFSEIVHFRNLFNVANLFGFVLFTGFGILFCNMIKAKKAFYTISVSIVFAWLVCEIVNSMMLLKETSCFFGISILCFTLSWMLFCFLLGAWIFYLICFMLHK